MARVSITIPFNMIESELEPDPASYQEPRSWQRSLEWLVKEANEEEVIRILTSAVVLYHHHDECTIEEALDTGIIWERG